MDRKDDPAAPLRSPKPRTRPLLALVLSAALLAAAPLAFGAPVFAGIAPSVHVAGPTDVRADDLIVLAVELSGNQLHKAGGELIYDTTQLQFVELVSILSGWDIAVDAVSEPGRIFYEGGDVDDTHLIDGTAQLVAFRFRVNVALAKNTDVWVTARKVYGTTLGSEVGIFTSDATWSVRLLASRNCQLASLKVGNATLSPAFSPLAVNYTTKVPYEVESLSITAKAASPAARVAVSKTPLGAGLITNVYITVTAEDGTTLVYCIAAERAPAPPSATPTSKPTEPPAPPVTATPTPAPATPTPEPTADPDDDPGGGIPPWMLPLAGLVLLAAGGAAGFLLARGRRQKPE